MIAYLPFRNYPPTIDVLLTTTAALSRAGYSRLLVDWWDMFPWSIQFAPVPRYAYTEVEIDAFAQYASSLELEIIPVISLYASGSPILSLPALSHLRKDDELWVRAKINSHFPWRDRVVPLGENSMLFEFDLRHLFIRHLLSFFVSLPDKICFHIQTVFRFCRTNKFEHRLIRVEWCTGPVLAYLTK